MPSAAQTIPTSKRMLRTGQVLSALAVLFLLFDSVIKVMTIPPVVDAFTHLGYPPSLARGIGTLELVCITIYLVPRTSVLGAVLLTGFLGGAIAIHLRVGDPLISHVLFPSYVGLFVWGGLLLRDDRLRAIVPLRA